MLATAVEGLIMERSENIFELVTDNPVRFNILSLKSKLAMTLIVLIRNNDWTQADAAKAMGVSQPRVSNLFKGKIDKFSVDYLLEMIIRIGYRLDVDFDPTDNLNPLEIKLKKKAAL